jgi:ElaB/YqjD/DUF883 family membrane-anchored ribosome-binding protein
MSHEPSTGNSPSFIDRAALSADQAIQSSQTAARRAMDGLAQSAHGLQDDAQHATQRGVEALRHGTQSLRDSAQRASENTRHYVQAEPVKAMLIAAATGATLMALASLLMRPRR